MAIIVAAAVAGVFGNGWLSSAEAGGASDLTVRYPRFSRSHSPIELSVEWLPRGAPTLWFDRSYLARFRVESIRPAPAAVAVDAGRIYYTFSSRSPTARIEVDFTLEAKRGGVADGRIGSEGGQEVEWWQLMFP